MNGESEGNGIVNNCNHIKDVGPYHDGELSPEARRRVEAHLERCEICAAELEQLRGISRLIGNAVVPTLSGAARRRLYAPANRMPQRSMLKFARQLTAAAAAVLIICSGVAGIGFGTREASAEMPSSWELAAIKPDLESAESETQQFVNWIVVDLSRVNGHD